MTEKDLELIRIAENTDYCDWMSIEPEQAETQECYDRLHVIQSMKYHEEEAMCGCI